MVRWHSDILDKFVAPGISGFTRAEMPDLRSEFPEAGYWLVNHFQNNVWRGSFKPRARQVALFFLRRAHTAFTVYHRARELTLDFLQQSEPHSPRLGAYYVAIEHWEAFAINFWMLAKPYVWLSAGVKAFEACDGSATFRLHSIGNKVKHFVGDFDGDKTGPGACLPLWLSNEGLCSTEHGVTFVEAASELRHAAEYANALQDPRSFIEGLPDSSEG
jgi:hypothetical protein